jgi:hypothetical protein
MAGASLYYKGENLERGRSPPLFYSSPSPFKERGIKGVRLTKT